MEKVSLKVSELPSTVVIEVEKMNVTVMLGQTVTNIPVLATWQHYHHSPALFSCSCVLLHSTIITAVQYYTGYTYAHSLVRQPVSS